MSRTSKKPTKQLSRSIRLRKYESAYETCLKTINNKDKPKKSYEEKKVKVKEKESGKKVKEKEKESSKKEKESRKKEKGKITKSKDRKRPLNDYQKFVREESKKSKYQGMSSSERMLLISKVWRAKFNNS
jgi:hypothetical protein